jgi:hypothetical protein
MSTNGPNTLTVVLGAGASHDCVGNGIGARVNKEFRPPLTNAVFEERFDTILCSYDRVRAHLDYLRRQLSKKDANLESILREHFEAAKRSGDYWSFQIPLYFRELFWTISDGYFEGSSKYDTLVQRIMGSHFEAVLFLDMNYDLFVENALKRCVCHEFNDINSYIPSTGKWLLVKPHGSVKWARVLENCPGTAQTGYLPTRLNEVPKLSPGVWVVGCNGLHRDYYFWGIAKDGYPYPAMVIPADEDKNFVCPMDHVEKATRFLGSCHTYLVIGYSARDAALMELLQRMPDNSHISIVSAKDTRTIRKRLTAGLGRPTRRNLQFSLYDSGFAKYVDGVGFRRLLENARTTA